MRRWQLAAAAGIMGAGALAAWCFREELTARAIAERSPGQGLAAAAFLIGLYALKGLSLTFPISALTAAVHRLEELADRRRRDSRQRERLLWAAALSGAGLFIILLI